MRFLSLSGQLWTAKDHNQDAAQVSNTSFSLVQFSGSAGPSIDTCIFSALSLLDIADAIILLKNDELLEVIKNSSPKILVLGSQYEKNTEKGIKDSISLLSKRGISVIYHGGEVSYFGSELLRSDEEEIKYKRLEEFKSACKRQSLNKENLLKSIESWG